MMLTRKIMITRLARSALPVAALLGVVWGVPARATDELSDEELAGVEGRNGISVYVQSAPAATPTTATSLVYTESGNALNFNNLSLLGVDGNGAPSGRATIMTGVDLGSSGTTPAVLLTGNIGNYGSTPSATTPRARLNINAVTIGSGTASFGQFTLDTQAQYSYQNVSGLLNGSGTVGKIWAALANTDFYWTNAVGSSSRYEMLFKGIQASLSDNSGTTVAAPLKVSADTNGLTLSSPTLLYYPRIAGIVFRDALNSPYGALNNSDGTAMPGMDWYVPLNNFSLALRGGGSGGTSTQGLSSTLQFDMSGTYSIIRDDNYSIRFDAWSKRSVGVKLPMTLDVDQTNGWLLWAISNAVIDNYPTDINIVDTATNGTVSRTSIGGMLMEYTGLDANIKLAPGAGTSSGMTINTDWRTSPSKPAYFAWIDNDLPADYAGFYKMTASGLENTSDTYAHASNMTVSLSEYDTTNKYVGLRMYSPRLYGSINVAGVTVGKLANLEGATNTGAYGIDLQYDMALDMTLKGRPASAANSGIDIRYDQIEINSPSTCVLAGANGTGGSCTHVFLFEPNGVSTGSGATGVTPLMTRIGYDDIGGLLQSDVSLDVESGRLQVTANTVALPDSSTGRYTRIGQITIGDNSIGQLEFPGFQTYLKIGVKGH